jgi:dynein heavy chain, axonemal
MASMRTFKEENRIAITDEFFGSGGNDEEKIGQEAFLVGDETHKQMPYTQEATLKTHFRKLSKFVRLADFFILDARFKLINHAINFVIETIKLDFSQNRKHLINDKV